MRRPLAALPHAMPGPGFAAIAALGVTLALAGCSVAPTTAPPAAFDLGPPPEAAPASPGVHLRLAGVAAAPTLHGPGMHYRLNYRDPYRRETYRDSRWAADPAALAGQRLQLQLAQRACASAPARLAPALQLTLDEFVQEFDSASDSRARVRLRALIDAVPVAPGPAPERVFELTRAAATPDARGGVQALSAALDQALDEVLTWAAQAAPAAACR